MIIYAHLPTLGSCLHPCPLYERACYLYENAYTPAPFRNVLAPCTLCSRASTSALLMLAANMKRLVFYLERIFNGFTLKLHSSSNQSTFWSPGLTNLNTNIWLKGLQSTFWSPGLTNLHKIFG